MTEDGTVVATEGTEYAVPSSLDNYAVMGDAGIREKVRNLQRQLAKANG